MKVLQTIGHRNGFPPTPFYYRRDHHGVRIEAIVGQRLPEMQYSSEEWDILLNAINNAPATLQVSTVANQNENENRLHEIIRSNLPRARNTRILAYVSAILLHEGSVILDHGPRRGELDARVFLRRSEMRDLDFTSRANETGEEV